MLHTIEPKVLYEDADILAVDKPAGMLVHTDGLPAQAGREKPITLADWLVAKFPAAAMVGDTSIFADESDDEDNSRAGIVHRLDRDTSGVMLLAKTQRGFDCLKLQFKEHTIKKIYHAIVVGVPEDSRGLIDRPIGRSADGKSRSAARDARGELRDAETQYIVKQSARIGQESFSLIQAMPKTGRTHQIRVHLKAISHPIVGDATYGTSKNDLGLKRMALHAKVIQFVNCSGEVTRVEADYPADFAKALTMFGSQE